MANELYTRTNQKIYFAGLALDSWRQATADAAGHIGRIQAEREASLFHLYGAVLGLCHEILGFYRSPALSHKRVEKILTRTTLDLTPCPELGELLELSRNPNTWLSALLAQHAQLYQPARPFESGETTGYLEEEAVAVLLVDELAEVESWRCQLKALTLRFRESMTEW